MTDTTDYMRSRIIAHRDQPDIYDPPTREDMYDRILSDAETIKAAKELAAMQEKFIAAELNYQATPQDRGGSNGPKGKARKAAQKARNGMIEALAAFNAALENSYG